MSLGKIFQSGLNLVLDPLRLISTFMPGATGYGIRRILCKMKFKKLGKNCILDIGIRINKPKNISVDEYTWIDAHTTLDASLGTIKIGKRIHLAPFGIIIAGPEGIEISDYAAVGAGCQIYGQTKSSNSGRVVLEKDSLLGANSIVYPGVTIGEGAVVTAGSIITEDVPPWSIAVGIPPKLIGKRDKVTTPDI